MRASVPGRAPLLGSPHTRRGRGAFALALALSVALVLVAASAGRDGGSFADPEAHVVTAKKLIRAAIARESEASALIAKHGARPKEEKDIATAIDDLNHAAAEIRVAFAAEEITEGQELQSDFDLRQAVSFDHASRRALDASKKQLAIEELHDAAPYKGKALAVLPDAPINLNALTSPAGDGAITVSDVKCYIGTGGNPERDAKLLVNGSSTWYVQQVYPASYFPGGSPTAPSFFLENGPAPYAPPIRIFGGFGLTLSGDVGAITSGQMVMIKSPLINPDGTPVPGSNLNLTYKCP